MSDVIRRNTDTIFTDVMLRRINEIPPEYRDYSEYKLRKMAQPSLNLYEIKRAFWREMERVDKTGKRFVAENVYKDLASKSFFYTSVLQNPGKLAWLLSPMVKYEIKTKAILDKLSDRYEELVNMEITTVKRRKNEAGEWVEYTETCPKKALVLLQTIKNVEDRVNGLAIQKQITINTTEPAEKKASLDMGTVNERLKELEEKLVGSDPAIDV